MPPTFGEVMWGLKGLICGNAARAVARKKGVSMLRNSGGTRGETRSSALWGTGNRGSDSRANALWGRGTRGLVTAITAMLVLGVPLASTAAVSSSGRQVVRHVGTGHRHTYVSPGLLRLGVKFP